MYRLIEMVLCWEQIQATSPDSQIFISIWEPLEGEYRLSYEFIDFSKRVFYTIGIFFILVFYMYFLEYSM